MQKLVSKSKFAQLAGVNPSTVTRVVDTLLKPAVVGKRIDAAHPCAVDYLEKQARDNAIPAATGLDGLYEEAIQACQSEYQFGVSFIMSRLKISHGRAKSILDSMTANGVVPVDKPKAKQVKPKEKPAPKPKAAPKPPPIEYEEPPTIDKPPIDYGADTSMIHTMPDDIEAFADMTLRELIARFGTDAQFVDWLKATKDIEMINEKRLKNAQTKGELVSRDLIRMGIIEPFDACHIKMLTDGAKTITRRATAMHDSGRELDEIESFVKDQLTSFIRPVKAKVKRILKDA